MIRNRKRWTIVIIFLLIMFLSVVLIHSHLYPRKVSPLYGRCEVTSGTEVLTNNYTYTLLHSNESWVVENSTFNGYEAIKCFKINKIGPMIYLYDFEGEIKIYCRYYYIEMNAFFKTEPQDVGNDIIKSKISESIDDILEILNINVSPEIKYGDEDVENTISYSACCGLNLLILSIPVITYLFIHQKNYLLKEFFGKSPTKRSILLLLLYSTSFLLFYISVLMLYIFIQFDKPIFYILRIIIFILLGMFSFYYIQKYEKKINQKYYNM